MYSDNKIKKGNKQKNPNHPRAPRKTDDSRGETQMIRTGPNILGTDWGGDTRVKGVQPINQTKRKAKPKMTAEKTMKVKGKADRKKSRKSGSYTDALT